MKKKWIVVAFAACAIALTSCNVFSEPESIAVESVTLDTTTLTLAPSATRKLTAMVKPDNADDKTVVWSSSDTAVVMVDNDGTVGAIKTGTATITAKSADKTATCTVTVKSDLVAVESVTLDTTTLALAPGATRKLTATVKPDNADDKTVVWSSSDTAVVMVDNDGTVGAIKTGTATITAKSGDKTATCLVTVSETAVVNPDFPIAVDSITLSTTTLTIEPGKMRTLTATVTPSNAEDKIVTWSSSDEKVATVSDDGTVTAHAEGTATITAKAGGKEATCTIAVKPILIAVKSVSLNMTILTLTSGETGKLTATVTPSDADDSTVAWSSSNADVATVGNDGTVTAIKAGKATITAQAGDITAECAVSVNPILVENVTLDVTTLTLAPGMTKKLAATVKPDNADDKTVTWSSSNVEVAMVSNDGTIGAIKAGKTSITAQAGDITAECVVTVHTDHSYSGGKCTSCGARPYMENGTIDEDGVLTKYSGKDEVVIIPDGVTSIGRYVFEGCTNLVGVVIPNSVTSIEEMAFYKCTSLTNVVIPDSVTSIGGGTFYGCTSLTNVVIPDSVTSIGGSTFYRCTSLTSVVIPDSVTSIGGGTFYECESLTNVVIPDSVTSIGGSTFYGCTSLTSVVIPDSVTSIKEGTFYGCTSLTSVVIPNSVTSIETRAFTLCENLTIVKYDGTLTDWCGINFASESNPLIEGAVLYIDGKPVTDALIPKGVTEIKAYAFACYTSLTSVVIPDSVTSIGRDAFHKCESLTSVTISGSVTSIGKDAFSWCKGLKSVTILTGVKCIDETAFAWCESLTSVTIPGSVTSIGISAFIWCKGLKSVTILTGVKCIDETAFAWCTSLTSVTIPNSVTTINVGAFRECRLNSVNYDGTKTEWDKISIDAESGLSGKIVTGSDGSTWIAE
ncbi:MAG: leucine-rich repeat protein [Treponema sp.]|nr:leucine-rich repeat protein [Treponema sp.]